MVDPQIDLRTIFPSSAQDIPPSSGILSLEMMKSTHFSLGIFSLKGMICYVSAHYLAYIWQPNHKKWFLFNDSTVVEVQFNTLPNQLLFEFCSLNSLTTLLRGIVPGGLSFVLKCKKSTYDHKVYIL